MLKSIFYIILFLVIGELTVYLINMPIPGNVIGMLLIFTALSLKVIKLENVKPAADFLTRNLGLFFVPPGVGLIEIAAITGGIPSLTAGLVIGVGILGAASGPAFLQLSGIRDPLAFGLSMGTASHGIGTARALEHHDLSGAASALAMCINGIVTAIATPYILNLMIL